MKEKQELKIRRKRENDTKAKNHFRKRMKKNAVELLNKLTPGITWTQDLMKKRNAKDIEDVDLEVIYSLPANKGQYLGYIMLYDFFPHTVKCLIADGLSYTAKYSYEYVLDFNTAYFRKHEYALILLIWNTDTNSVKIQMSVILNQMIIMTMMFKLMSSCSASSICEF